MKAKLFGVRGLALEGGAMFGQAYPAMLARIEAGGARPTAFAGTSAGALVALLCALGYSAADIQRLQDGTDWRAWSSGNLISQAWRAITSQGLHRLDVPRKWIEDAITGAGHPADVTMGDLADATGRRLAVVATRFGRVSAGGRERLVCDSVAFEAGAFPDVVARDAVLASMAIPLYYPPVQVGDWWCADGGIGRNLPVDVLEHWGLAPDQVVALRVDSGLEVAGAIRAVDYRSVGRIEAMRAIVQMIRSGANDAHVSKAYWPRVVRVIAPDGVDPLDFGMSAERVGALRAAGVAALEEWLRE